MVLIKMLVGLVALHVGCGFVQMSVTYFGSNVPDYGAQGVISHTLIGTLLNIDDPSAVSEDGQETNPANFKALPGLCE